MDLLDGWFMPRVVVVVIEVNPKVNQ